MQPKIFWIDNLRGIACLMVVMIHTTTWYITNAQSVSPLNWDLANVLNSASRVSVPLFFMISGYLFFGERSAKPRHFLRITLCILFYSSVALAYILLFFRCIDEGFRQRHDIANPQIKALSGNRVQRLRGVTHQRQPMANMLAGRE